MTPDEREAVLSLVTYPGSSRASSPEAVLRHFGVTDGEALGLNLLRDALERQNGLNVELALIVCGIFGFTRDHLELLVRLSSADWHQRHEDVASGLGKLRNPDAVEALYKLTQWIPNYLEYDENRALATKAIWALGGTPGPEAEEKLRQLLESEDEILREDASEQLERCGPS